MIFRYSGFSSPLCASFYLSFALHLRFIPFLIPISCPCVRLTGGDDALQPDDVGVVKLSQDAGLAEEGAPLLVGAAGAERLDGHRQLPLAGQLEAAAANLAEVAWGWQRKKKSGSFFCRVDE